MGYSKSKNVVVQLQPLLEAMLKIDDKMTQLKIDTEEPAKLSYLLRNALYVIEQSPEEFPKYSTLLGKFNIKADEKKNYVLIKQRFPIGKIDPIASLSKSRLAERHDGVDSLFGIIAALTTGNASPELEFPDAKDLSEEDLGRLYKVASSRGYHIVLKNGVTLTKELHNLVQPWVPPNATSRDGSPFNSQP